MQLLPIYNKNRVIATAICDNKDHTMLSEYRWSFDGKNYVVGYKKGQSRHPIRMSRLIMDCPRNLQCDHINHSKCDNRRSNLRIVDNKQNKWNSLKQRTWYGHPTTSKFKGVSWDKKNKKWMVSLCVDGRRLSLGRYEDEIEAATRYNDVAKLEYGEYCLLNKI